MDIQELAPMIRRRARNYSTDACLCCGWEHNCKRDGCALMLESANKLEEQRKELEKLQSDMNSVKAKSSYVISVMNDVILGNAPSFSNPTVPFQ